MGWHHDGSGLLVYRHRGRTVKQRHTIPCDNSADARDMRRSCGWLNSHEVFARGKCGPRRLRADNKRISRQRHEMRDPDSPF